MDDEPQQNDPYFLDEPRRAEEEAIARAAYAQAQLKRLIRNSEESAREWDEIFRQAASAANERC